MSASVGGRPASDGVDFGVKARLDLRVLAQEIPGPRQRVRGGFVTGQEEGDAPRRESRCGVNRDSPCL